MPRDTRTYLWDTVRAADLIGSFVAGRSFADYEADAMLRSAVERQFEIIGEALGQLARADPQAAALIPDLARIVAFRNILIHGYATVDDAVVWDAAVHKRVTLREQVAALLDTDVAADRRESSGPG